LRAAALAKAGRIGKWGVPLKRLKRKGRSLSVKVEQLTKIYGDQRAVDEISFEVLSGEIVGFLGPNGAGKSTTMKMLTCYLSPTSGKAFVSGFNIEDDSIEVRKRIGYLPEHNPLYTEMYVKEYLRFIAGISKYSGHVTNRVNELIDMTGLGIEKHKKIGMLSKGYRQRVGLAQAMLHNPEVLILDEPTSGLDPNQIVEIRNLIKEVGKEKTVILSTHIMQEVQAMCSRVIIINKGKIAADSTTEELTNRVSGRNLLRVEFKNPADVQKLLKIPGVIDVEAKGKGYILYSSGTDDLRESVFKWAVENNNTIYELVREGQSLENIFQTLTQ
jgi:ABC-2 type transport system ATP-binding protein